MDHSMSMASSGSSASHATSSMNMGFTNAYNTPLFSSTWTPTSSGAYAGTCIFLILLAAIGRCLIAFKAIMERYWMAKHLNRRYIAIAGKTTEEGRINADPDAKLASLVTAQGVEESVKVVRNTSDGPVPWRFSVDLPRAGLFLCIATVLYLSMLAIMTLNVGYFCSILAGTFLGELVAGRHVHWNEHAHH